MNIGLHSDPIRRVDAHQGGVRYAVIVSRQLTLPLYAFLPADLITSGDKYSAVPTNEAGAEWNLSCCNHKLDLQQESLKIAAETMKDENVSTLRTSSCNFTYIQVLRCGRIGDTFAWPNPVTFNKGL